MSQHPSLRVGGKIRKQRNVMKRYERLDLLRAEGKIPETKFWVCPRPRRSKVSKSLPCCAPERTAPGFRVGRFFVFNYCQNHPVSSRVDDISRR